MNIFEYSQVTVKNELLPIFTETALHIAVKNKHHSIVSMLLAAGANPNLRVYLPDDEMARLAEDEYIFTGLIFFLFCFV